jgi:manganese/zinc/iron transport system permease protein
MIELWSALWSLDWSDPNLRWVVIGATLLGVAAASLGCFAFLRGRSLLGDALAHAALPGVCAAFLFAEWLRPRGFSALDPKSLPILLPGAAISAFGAAWSVNFVTARTKLKEDTAQALVLSLFFGFGVVLLTRIQNLAGGNQSGLDKFLFGQAASFVPSDLRMMTILAVGVCLITALLYKEFKLLCFDAGFGAGLGWPVKFLDGVLLFLIVTAVVIGLQAVGVVLIAALLVIPAASARYWTDNLGRMVLLAAIFGGLSGAGGAICSALAVRLPTGPLVVLSAALIFAISLLFAPERGWVARSWMHLKTRKRVRRENALRDIFELTESVIGEELTPQNAAMPLPSLALQKLQLRRSDARIWLLLEREGLLEKLDNGELRLSARGLEAAYQTVKRHRLWEMFLLNENLFRNSILPDAAHSDADAVEHFLTPEALDELEKLAAKR